MKDSTHWIDKFMDFYFEKGDYAGRIHGPTGYITFIQGVEQESYTKAKKQILSKVGMLRQWINERPVDSKLLTNEDIRYWLNLESEK